MGRHKTFFGEIVDLDALSPEAQQIYAAIRRVYDKNINKEPETDHEAKYFHVEWLLLLEAYLAEITKLRKSRGGGKLVLKDADVLDKLYIDLETRLCLKKQEQRADKKA